MGVCVYVVSVCSEHQAMVELAHTVRTEGALQHKQRRESYRRVREEAGVSGRKDGNNKYKVKLKDGETFFKSQTKDVDGMGYQMMRLV